MREYRYFCWYRVVLFILVLPGLTSIIDRYLLIFYLFFIFISCCNIPTSKNMCLLYFKNSATDMDGGKMMTAMTYSWETLGLQVSPLRNPSEGVVAGSRVFSRLHTIFYPRMNLKVLCIPSQVAHLLWLSQWVITARRYIPLVQLLLK